MEDSWFLALHVLVAIGQPTFLLSYSRKDEQLKKVVLEVAEISVLESPL